MFFRRTGGDERRIVANNNGSSNVCHWQSVGAPTRLVLDGRTVKKVCNGMRPVKKDGIQTQAREARFSGKCT